MAMTGPTRTADDLIQGVLKELKVKSAGQPTDPEDYAYVSEEIDSVLASLGVLNIVNIPDPDITPAEYYRPLVAIVAGEVCEKFGVNADDYAALKANAAESTKLLREMARGRPTYERLRVEYI